MFEASSDVSLKASPSRVWRTVTAFDQYPSWTSAIRISGGLEPGEPLDYTIIYRDTSGRMRTRKLMGVVKEVCRMKRLAWRVSFPVLFVMDLSFDLARRPGRHAVPSICPGNRPPFGPATAKAPTAAASSLR
ncbi:SRPBCC family protein [Sinorhizobium meliloti]|uniref:SRPBCC family protein n=1 Tax=Rhizobium meliloti TaxID=382 RepID=UPI000FD71CB1|nr:SRPBCC family protein [Sinorhizobium meliloti]RVO59202.1 hypothetical protein CN092_07995 [Sinorhizobium meliloti]